MAKDSIDSPPLLVLLALALVLWGTLTTQALAAAVMVLLAVVLPAAGLRLQLGDRLRLRLAMLGTLLFWVWVAGAFIDSGPIAIYRVLAKLPWLPFCWVLAQLHSADQRLPRSVLSPSLGRPEALRALGPDSGLDARPLWAATALVAAGASAEAPLLIYLGGLSVLIFAALYMALTADRRRALPFLGAALAVLALHAGLQQGVRASFDALEAMAMAWLGPDHRQVDPLRSETRIGALIDLKDSEQIELRVAFNGAVQPPIRLAEAVYDQYYFGTWTARDRPVATIDRPPGATGWRWGPPGPLAELEIIDYLPRDSGVIALPFGTAAVSSTTLLGLARNGLGTVTADGRPGYQRYTAMAGQGEQGAPPGESDRVVPEFLHAALKEQAERLGLPGLSPAAAVARLSDWFGREFQYSLDPPPYRSGRALIDFLQQGRRGHCEYFATAGTLLLRAAGIPSRYVVGFWVNEWSPLEGRYIARASHAHAWTQVWTGNAWVEADFTPPGWIDFDAEGSGFARLLADFTDWLAFFISGTVAAADTEAVAQDRDWAPALVFGLSLLLVGLRWRRGRQKALAGHASGFRRDELDRALQRLGRRGLGPLPGETLAHCLVRLAPHLPGLAAAERDELIALHARSRYAAVPLSPPEQARLQQLARTLATAAQPSA